MRVPHSRPILKAFDIAIRSKGRVLGSKLLAHVMDATPHVGEAGWNITAILPALVCVRGIGTGSRWSPPSA